ncbi:MAG: hypothetical protein ACRELD_00615 [Longimicrobiales bacterium]
MIETLLVLFLIGLVGLVVLALLGALFGVLSHLALGLGGFLLFRLLPILALGWIIVRFLAPRRSELDASRDL